MITQEATIKMMITSFEMDVRSLKKETQKDFLGFPYSYVNSILDGEEEQWNRTKAIIDKI